MYPKGQLDHTPSGTLGKMTRCLGLDMKSRPVKDGPWLEKEGKKRHKGGRHKACPRPNLFRTAGVIEAEGAGIMVERGDEAAEPGEREENEGGGGYRDGGRVHPAAVGGDPRPADEVSAAWRRQNVTGHRDDDDARLAVEAVPVNAQPREREAVIPQVRNWNRGLQPPLREGEVDPYREWRGMTDRIVAARQWGFR